MNHKLLWMGPERTKGDTETFRGIGSQCSVGGRIIQNGKSKSLFIWRLLLYFCINMSISDVLDFETILTKY